MGIIYESSIIENDKTIRDKYICIVIEYLINISYKNVSPFIISRGLDTITHVFILLLYYTNILKPFILTVKNRCICILNL